MERLRGLLTEIYDMFPDETKKEILLPCFYQHMLDLKTLQPYLTQNPRAKILDVGAGSGWASLTLKKAGFDVWAIDTWEAFQREFRDKTGIKEGIIQRLKDNGVHVGMCDIERESFPFEDESFDIILHLGVIEHLHCSPKRTLSEIHRVLKPGGILILTTPNLATLKNRLYVLFGKSNYVDLHFWYNCESFFVGHTREYTVDEILKMLIWEGFNISDIKLSNVVQKGMKQIQNRGVRSLTMALYLLVTSIYPRFRYFMLVIAKK